MLPLAALIFVNDTDLHILNSSSDTVEEVVTKSQQLLDAWHEITIGHYVIISRKREM